MLTNQCTKKEEIYSIASIYWLLTVLSNLVCRIVGWTEEYGRFVRFARTFRVLSLLVEAKSLSTSCIMSLKMDVINVGTIITGISAITET